MKKMLLIGIACFKFLNAEAASALPFIAGADYLYWKTEQDGMGYGSITKSQTTSLSEDLSGLPVNPTSLAAAHTKIIRPHFKYGSGFRAWLGYAPPCTGFHCTVIYTYLPNHTSKTNAAESEEIISSVFAPLPLSSLKAKWSSYFNQLDVDFGRTIDLGTFLELDPHIGVRGVIVKQRFNATSNFASPVTLDSGVGLPVGTNTAFNRWKQNYHGIGIEGGLRAAINFDCGLSLIGHCGGAILYSKFKVKDENEAAIIAEGSSTPTVLSYDRDTIWAPMPVIDYFIGLSYSATCYETYLSFHIGWEEHVFFDMNRLQVGGNEYGNFSTAGLTAGIDGMF